MIATATASPAKPAATPAGAPAASAGGGGFAALLAPTASADAPTPVRQDAAGDGKDLPEEAAVSDVWLALIGASVAPAPLAAPTLPPTPTPATSPLAPPVTPQLDAVRIDTLPVPPTDIATAAATGPAPIKPPAITLAPEQPAAIAATAGQSKADAAPAPLPAPTPTSSAAVTVAAMAERPAPLLQGQPARATATIPVVARSAERERAGEARLDGTIQLPLVAAAIEAHRTMLDLRQEHWPQRMVEHIETLRDAADAADTRIRLVPDALGTIDVRLRREGDTVHVGFVADRAETRTLLEQAQPKLAELGEARGLRFAHGGADTPGQSPQRHVPAPRTSASPPATADAAPPADDDTIRIA